MGYEFDRGGVMARESSKVTIEDTKFNSLFSSYHANEITVKSTLHHRMKGRYRREINKAKFEARRTNNEQLIIDAGVRVLMGIVG